MTFEEAAIIDTRKSIGIEVFREAASRHFYVGEFSRAAYKTSPFRQHYISGPYKMPVPVLVEKIQ